MPARVSQDKKPSLNADIQPVLSHEIGFIEKIDDKENRDFYGSSVTDSYRIKSELVSKCMQEIGMGRFQWELFVVSGFGWITDNL